MEWFGPWHLAILIGFVFIIFKRKEFMEFGKGFKHIQNHALEWGQLSSHGIKVDATVIKVEQKTKKHKKHNKHIYIEFEVEGRMYSDVYDPIMIKRADLTDKPISVGDTLAIYYLPDNPTVSMGAYAVEMARASKQAPFVSGK